jgi:hypothetical protein
MAKIDVIVGWTGETEAIPGSVRLACALCGAVVWLAPSGQRVLVSDGAAVWCIPCAGKNVSDSDQVVTAPGAEREFMDSLKRQRN